MAWLRTKRTINSDINDIAQSSAHADQSTAHFGNWITAIASAVALIFSAVSLYHSVLKQPDLQFYVSPVVHYARDPEGNYEVFAIPVTVANHGARDGTVLSIDLEASSANGSEAKQFYSAYVVDGSYFVKPGRYDIQTRKRERVDRPKQPFAPVSVPGRASYSGTILFYTKGKAFPKIVHEKGDYNLKLTLNTRLDNSLGPIDALLHTITKPVAFTTRLNNFHENTLLTGGTHRMFNIDWSVPVAETESRSAGDSAP